MGAFLLVWALWTPISLLSPPYLAAVDGHFHIKVASFYAQRGPFAFSDGRFPWLRATVFAEQWSDIEYLFHLLIAPFTLGWEAPPPRVGPVAELDLPLAKLSEGAKVQPGARLYVRPAAGLEPVAVFEVTAVESGGQVRGRFVEVAPEAPLRAGYRVDGAGAIGELLHLGTGQAVLPEDPALNEGALLTLFGDRRYLGRARLATGGGGRVPFALVHLRPSAHGALDSGGLELDDHRGFVDPELEDIAEVERFVAGRGEPLSALPEALRAPRRLLGPDTLVQRARLAVAFLQALIIFALGYVLRRNAGRWAWIGAALLVLGSDFFAYRFFMCRPQLLSMSCMLLGWHLALNRRHLLLGAVGAVYALTYVAPHALLALVGLVAAVDLVAGGRDGMPAGWWKPVAAVAAGIVAGLALHPNAINHLRLLAVVNVSISSSSFLAPVADALGRLFDTPLFTAGPQIDAAIEFHEISGFDGLRMFSIWLPALVLLAAFVVGRIRPSRATLAAGVATLAWWVLFLRSQRFIEYLAPFAALAFTLAIRDLWQAGYFRRLRRLKLPARLAVAGALGLAGLLVLVRAVYGAVDAVGHISPAPQREAALYLRSHAPEGAKVFETEWDDTVVLLHFSDRQRYLVALDPHYMFHHTPRGRAPGEIFRLWSGVIEGRTRITDPGQGRERDWVAVVREDFETDYMVALQQRDVLLANLRAAPGVVEAYSAFGLSVFDLRGGRD
ncbi:MAG: hypothetical protein ACOX6T_27840 [Myxococcales bacterium]|jgi:hypothetical protein